MTPGSPQSTALDVAAGVRARSGGIRPRAAIVLGSGLGLVAEAVEQAKTFSYDELPGFPSLGVAGHAGRLIVGEIAGLPVAVLQGRAHYYEQGKADIMKQPLRVLAALGCNTLLLTNAAGSLRAEAGPGSLMLIADHINFTGVSPLFGERDDRRFLDLVEAYDPALRATFQAAAASLGLTLREGVYLWTSGPNFETPAEVRAARLLGADAVGMSTVPEVILARHAGLRVGALSLITNLAAGMSDAALSHAQTLALATQAAEDVKRLLVAVCRRLATEKEAAA